MDQNIVYLQISSWRGMSIGAVHYYGKLVCGENRVQLKKKLSATEAKYFNEKDRWDLWREGDEIDRFHSKDELMTLALASWRIRFPNAILLILGKTWIAEPQRVLDGPNDLKKRINILTSKADRIGRWSKDKETMQAIWDEWRKIMDEMIQP